MQDLPEKSMLLEALAKFIDAQVRPEIRDPALAFRVRIAAHLAGVVAREIRAEDQHDLAELARLEAIEGIGEGRREPLVTREERRRRISELVAKLAAALRKGTLSAEARTKARAHLK